MEDTITKPSITGLGLEPELPHVVKRFMQDCGSAFENYCLNNGKCMLQADMSEHHCRCDIGFSGPRCGHLELITQPMAEGQTIVVVFCVILLIIGLAGALYFCCKWYKKNRLSHKQKQQGYKGVQQMA